MSPSTIRKQSKCRSENRGLRAGEPPFLPFLPFLLMVLVGAAGCGDAGYQEDDFLGESLEPVCTAQPGPVYGGMTLWPGGVIPYRYDSIPGTETGGGMQQAIRQMMNTWQSVTGDRILFTQSATNPEALVIKNIYGTQACTSPCPSGDFCNAQSGKCFYATGTSCATQCSPTSTFPMCDGAVGLCRTTFGCNSSVGWESTEGTQLMWLADGQCDLGHELGHAVGLYHEHQRFDRDRYIDMFPATQGCNDSSMWQRFLVTEDDALNTGEYDVNSTMHYNSANPNPSMTLNDGVTPILTGMGAPDILEGSKITEMYARELGAWKRSVSMGIDVASTIPLQNIVAPGVTITAFSTPAVARTQSTLDVFVRGTNNSIYRRTTSARGKPNWGGWSSIAGNANSSPGATALAPGQLAVAVLRSDGFVYLAEQTQSWAWNSIGKPPGVTVAGTPALAASPSGSQLDVFIRGTNNRMYQKRRSAGSWGVWLDRGGTLSGSPAAVYTGSATVTIFSNTPSGNLVQGTINVSTFSGFANVANGACCLAANTSPAVSKRGQRLDVLVRSVADRLWWKRFDGVGWTTWWWLGGTSTSDPVMASFDTARIDAFFLAPGANLRHRQHRANRSKGDFDGDGLADFGVFRPSTSTWHVWLRSGAPPLQVPFNAGLTAGIPEDYDNDGKADPVAFRPSDGAWVIKRTTGGPDMTALWGLTTDRLQPGDFNGDGLADYTLFRPSDGKWHIAPSRGYVNQWGDYRGAPAWEQPWGGSGDIMTPGDYDADQKTDVALYRPSEGKWYIIQSSTGAAQTIQHGLPTDIPVPGDYDGDGKTDSATFQPSNGDWLILMSSTGTFVSKNTFTSTADRPVPKDYDGDDKTDVAVWTPSTGVWKVLPSGGGTTIQLTWGVSTDQVF